MAGSTIRSEAERGLLPALLLSGVTLILEVVGGILSGSLALLSDALHVLLDLRGGSTTSRTSPCNRNAGPGAHFPPSLHCDMKRMIPMQVCRGAPSP